MKRTFLVIISALLIGNLWAQTALEEIKQNPCLAGANYLAYPTPTKALTPAPQGKKPFYISHYGRHGSRYLIGKNEYYDTYDWLKKADEAGKLTEKGKQLLEDVRLMKEESENRYGELTELGAEQHRQIAKRMYERFPEVFKGDVHVDAKSTIVIRCILSMENELQELLVHNPKLQITHDASEHDMYYMNYFEHNKFTIPNGTESNNFLTNWTRENINPDRFIQTIFNDADYANDKLNKRDFFIRIFDLATILQNSELRKKIDMYDLFTSDELYLLWQRKNMGWFIGSGSNSISNGYPPYSQSNLLRNVIHEADSCIALDRPGATLRFGHESMVLPFTCLLNLNGYGEMMHPKDLVKNNWNSYKIFPMGCNVQFIFYRKNPQDKDVWVKVLLNEEEATLPIKAVSGPYYRWSEVREYYLNKLDAFKF